MKDNRNYASGSLPERAPLASAYVPMQESAEPNYEPATALARGTLFPGLDLPFMNMVNQPGPATPLSELMAVDFVADELRLYLDTHKDDTEAFEMLQRILALSSQAHREYAAQSQSSVICHLVSETMALNVTVLDISLPSLSMTTASTLCTTPE